MIETSHAIDGKVEAVYGQTLLLEKLPQDVQSRFREMGLTIVADDAVPGDQLWLIASTPDGAKIKLVFDAGPFIIETPRVSP